MERDLVCTRTAEGGSRATKRGQHWAGCSRARRAFHDNLRGLAKVILRATRTRPVPPFRSTKPRHGVGASLGDYFSTRLFAGLTAIGTIRLTLLSLLHERELASPQSSRCQWDPARVNLRHAGPLIIQRPSDLARSPPLAGSGEAENTKDPAERRSGDGSARHEQPFNLLELEAGVARPLVDLDPRRASVAQDCFQHGTLHSAHTPDPQPEAEPHKYATHDRESVSWVTLLNFFERPVRRSSYSPPNPSSQPRHWLLLRDF
jgi:hypothetical protein